jgi:glycosyltransferase involved in cell wall biosynthesis
MNAINSFVYVSSWQHEKFRYLFKIPTENSYVIKNAIEPIEFKKREKKEKIKIIYTSALNRGLDVLLDSIDLLDRDDIEVDVYSSKLLYGSDYAEHHSDLWNDIIEKAKNIKSVNYMEYAENKEIHKALQGSHMFAYPSTFEETSCLSMIESGAAGCKMVTTNIGALYETGSEYATLMPIQADRDTLVKNYAKVLNSEIDSYWSESNQEMLKKQSEYYNTFYSWEKRSKEWNMLFEKISDS